MSDEKQPDPSVELAEEIEDAAEEANESGAGYSGGWVCTISAEITGKSCNPF